MTLNWKPRHTWTDHADTFAVEVSRHTSNSFLDEGPNRWCIYVYIYPKHPLFAQIDLNGGIWQNLPEDLHLHGGCTSFTVYKSYGGEITSVKIGCDYSHYGDDHYMRMGTKEEAKSVFSDAEELFNWMLAKVEPAPRDIAPRDLEGGER